MILKPSLRRRPKEETENVLCAMGGGGEENQYIEEINKLFRVAGLECWKFPPDQERF